MNDDMNENQHFSTACLHSLVDFKEKAVDLIALERESSGGLQGYTLLPVVD